MKTECKIPICKSKKTKPCLRCQKPVCMHHSRGYCNDVPVCMACCFFLDTFRKAPRRQER